MSRWASVKTIPHKPLTSITPSSHKTQSQRRKNKWAMSLTSTRNSGKHKDLAGMLKTLDAECRNCAPTHALECITRCQVYKLKNELRKLRETMDNPNYIKELFNVLKKPNKTPHS